MYVCNMYAGFMSGLKIGQHCDSLKAVLLLGKRKDLKIIEKLVNIR